MLILERLIIWKHTLNKQKIDTMNLAFLDEIYKEIFSGDIRYLVYSAKGIAAIIIVVMMVKRLSISFTSTGKMLSDNKEGFNVYELIRMFLMLFLALAADQVISGLDYILGIVEEEALIHINPRNQDFFEISKYQVKKPQGTGESGIFSYYLGLLLEKLSLFRPDGGISPIAELIGKIIDMIIYPLFLGQRYFFLGLLKIFAPIVFALSIYDKLRDYCYNIMKLYAKYTLVIIPFMFVNIMANALYDGVLDLMHQNTVGQITMFVATGPIKFMGMIFIIILKISLFKKSFEIMDKIFT